jgi:hypothetical protein
MFYNPTKAAEKYAKDKRSLKDKFESGILSFISRQQTKVDDLTFAIDGLEVSKVDAKTAITEAKTILKGEK